MTGRASGTRDVPRLRLASPEQMRAWSSGEVTEPRTLHSRSNRPVPGGLFCEQIFGPLVEERCRCGHVTGNYARRRTCSRCGTQVLRRRGLRQRMGHIELAAPVVHSWFRRLRPGAVAILLDLKPGAVDRIVQEEAWLVLRGDRPRGRAGRVLTRKQRDHLLASSNGEVDAATGAVALERALAEIDLDSLAAELRHRQREAAAAGQRLPRKRILRRLNLVEKLRAGGVRPAWMVLRCLPVVSPRVRPLVPLGSGKYATDEVNELYRRVIACNNLLRQLIRESAPEILLSHQRHLLQRTVDALFDHRRPARSTASRRPRRSLALLLSSSKQGLFRNNLLGKRVDYSGRAVIVVGPTLELHQVGLPRTIALRLFEPMLLGRLRRAGVVQTLRHGRQLLHELLHPEVLVDTARLIVAELVRQRRLAWGRDRLRRVEAGDTEDREYLDDLGEELAELDSPQRDRRGRALLAELPTPEAVRQVRACLTRHGRAEARRCAHAMLIDRQVMLWKLVRAVIEGHPVLLNRAPTLHRMGIQAFEPVLVDGNAIHLHPLVCRGFNADFDGDAMTVHLPLSREAIAEARACMTPANNLFKPASGQPIVVPTEDLVLGCHYLTLQVREPRSDSGTAVGGCPSAFTPPITDHGSGMVFASLDEVRLAHDLGKVGTHARIAFRLPVGRIVEEQDEQPVEKTADASRIATTVGRVLFNAILPPGLPFYNLTFTARRLTELVRTCHERFGPRATIEMLDRLEEIGFRTATQSGLSFATDDIPHPRNKDAILQGTRVQVNLARSRWEDGLADQEWYREQLQDLWKRARNEVTANLLPDLRHDQRNGRPYLNPLGAMIESGARGSADQVRQLAGMRGLMASISGRLIEQPITASLREGLPSWDFFRSAHGVRKGMTDRGVRTADAGYLTRKLVAAAQSVVVTTEDCGTLTGLNWRVPQGSLARFEGRVSQEEVRDEEGRIVVRPGECIGPEQARRLAELGRERLCVRSPIRCKALRGVCQRCYGTDLTTGRLVEIGAAVGIVAAQSIGEPGTQLIMRTFQEGGIAGQDIVNDLERVRRLLELSRPKRPALLAPATGVIRIVPDDGGVAPRGRFWGMDPLEEGEADVLPRWAGLAVSVRDGDRVEAGAELTVGDIDARRLLRLAGVDRTAVRLLKEVRDIYRTHNLDIDDRHFEVILARMLGCVQVVDAGATTLVPDQVLDRATFDACNAALAAGLRRATCRITLVGINRVAAAGPGFLAAASFQKSFEILASAALGGRIDRLVGLQENVLLGRRIPAGSGVNRTVPRSEG